MIKAVQKMTCIIELQNEIIGDMFMLLLQHVATEDESFRAVTEKINDAGELKNWFAQGMGADAQEQREHGHGGCRH